MHNAGREGKGVFEYQCSKMLFYFQGYKTIFGYEEGKDVFNDIGNFPAVKDVFSFFYAHYE